MLGATLTLILATISPALAVNAVTLTGPVGLQGLFLVDQTVKIVAPADSGVSYTYKWFADGTLINGESNSTLVLTPSHSGKTISASVVAAKSGFADATIEAVASATVITSAFTSNSSTIIDGVRTYEPYCTAPGPQGTATPIIGWNMRLSCQSLNTSLGQPTEHVYQWYRGSSAINGANQNTYNLRNDDAGQILSASYKAVFSNGAQFLSLLTSTSTIESEVTAAKPVITGTISHGSTLTATTVGFDGAATLSYQWFRDFLPISGATSRTYTVTSSDLDERIQVLVTGTRVGYTTSSAISDPVSSGSITNPSVAIYESVIDGYTPSNFVPDVTFVASDNVNVDLLNMRKAELLKAADFWRNDYVPVGNVAMYLTNQDATWADSWLATNHPTWSSNTSWWINNYDCGYAFAVRFQADYFFEQCLRSSDINSLDYKQITPHEYTHWVQYSKSSNLNTPATPWLIEGQANFYGLALGVAPEDPELAVLNLALARHAETFDSYFHQPWGTQEVLQKLKAGNVTDIKELLTRSGSANHSYMLGTLMSEWLVYEFGHETYWNWVSGILTGKAATGDNGVALTATLTQSYFGMSFDNLARNAIPYFAMRAADLEASWIEEITPDFPPDAPTIDSLTPGDGEVTVSWTPGAEHGAATLRYRVDWNGGSKDCDNSPCTITGLENGSAYQFRVIAISTLGDSNINPFSEFVTPRTVPTSPTSVQAIGGNAQAIVSWSNSAARGSSITGYEVKWDGGSQSCASSPCTITDLTNGNTYSFTVLAISAVGNSEESSASNSVTPTAPVIVVKKPTAPTTLKVVAVKVGASTLKWSGALANGAAISKYELSWKLSTSKTFGAWSSKGTKTSATISGWKKNKIYDVRIRVTNSAGQTISKVFKIKQSK
ncbi:MAG: hypothetical protein RIS75_1372 [Actinomycetota bacterium]